MAMRRISADRRSLLPLLLMGDEQESLVERYLDRCGLYVWEEAGEILAVCAAESFLTVPYRRQASEKS